MVRATSSSPKDKPSVTMAGNEIDRCDFAAANCRQSDIAFERIYKGQISGGAEKVKKLER